jgi:predicted ferric reductase
MATDDENRGELPAMSILQPGWPDSRVWGALLVGLYLALAALPLAATLIAAPPELADPKSVASELGRLAALLGLALLALQVVLTSRLRGLTRPFGLDRVTGLHRKMGVVAALLLLSHPLLLAAGHHGWSLLGLDTGWRVWLGKLTLLFAVVVVGLAVSFRKLGLQYQVWRFMHKSAVLVVLLGAGHGLLIGSDPMQQPGLRAYIWTLGGLVVAIFGYRNLFVPLWGRRELAVAAVEPESHDTYSLALQPRDSRPLAYRPGQFMFLRLVRPGRRSELHPFTISSSPTGGWPITATIKQSGDFTDTIAETRPGDRARVEAPYGRFSLLHHPQRPLVLIAGGVGITPLMSMLRFLRDRSDPRPVRLIFGNQSRRDILFADELAAMPESVAVSHVLTAPDDDWDGARGYVTGALIEQAAGELLDRAEFFVCGPPPMMAAVRAALRQLGVERRRIHWERFTL